MLLALGFALIRNRSARKQLVQQEAALYETIAQLQHKISAQEAERLKFQLQPHTLNNIMANLKMFANKLSKGMDSLSETLDYILYKGSNNLVSIQEELSFIKKYLALNDLFISEIDSIKFDYSQVDQRSKYYANPSIPHLITAYLIENAFKHGNQQHPDFLKIELILTDMTFAIIVVNKTRKKPSTGNGGIGLENMKKRLELLLPGKHEISRKFNDQEYISTLTIHF